MVDRATKRPMEESLEVVLARPCFRAMLRWDEDGSSATPPPESRSPLPSISDDDDGEADDVLMLVEQLDVATSAITKDNSKQLIRIK